MASDDKYDRQIRLWGANGQRALMNSHILLVGADAVGTETIKNLVLPGVGKFTVIDHQIVSEIDLGTNFFVDSLSIGKPRAQVVVQLLTEMNPDVQGIANLSNISQIIEEDPSFLSQFSLIITSNASPSVISKLATFCWESQPTSIPLLTVRAFGLLGTASVQLPNHEIVESKPDGKFDDLRINHPWPELKEFFESFNLTETGESVLSLKDHSFVPFPVILYQGFQDWKEKHGGLPPKTRQEKDAFRYSLAALYSRNLASPLRSALLSLSLPASSTDSSPSVPSVESVRCMVEENIAEAIANANQLLAPSPLPFEVEELIEQTTSQPLTSTSSPFTFLIHSLHEFRISSAISPEHQLHPLPGALPDFRSSSEWYLTMQRLYQAQAIKERETLGEIAQNLLKTHSLPSTHVSPDLLESFCRHIYDIRAVRTSSMKERESILHPSALEALNDSRDCDPDQDPLQHPLLWGLALRGADQFYLRHGRYPGQRIEQHSSKDADETEEEGQFWLESETDELWAILKSGAGYQNQPEAEGNSFLEEVGLKREHAAEIVRFGGKELHNLAAFIGGVGSLEAIKILTHQFVPIDNTYVFNGIAACGATYRM